MHLSLSLSVDLTNFPTRYPSVSKSRALRAVSIYQPRNNCLSDERRKICAVIEIFLCQSAAVDISFEISKHGEIP